MRQRYCAKHVGRKSPTTRETKTFTLFPIACTPHSTETGTKSSGGDGRNEGATRRTRRARVEHISLDANVIKACDMSSILSSILQLTPSIPKPHPPREPNTACTCRACRATQHDISHQQTHQIRRIYSLRSAEFKVSKYVCLGVCLRVCRILCTLHCARRRKSIPRR